MRRPGWVCGSGRAAWGVAREHRKLCVGGRLGLGGRAAGAHRLTRNASAVVVAEDIKPAGNAGGNVGVDAGQAATARGAPALRGDVVGSACTAGAPAGADLWCSRRRSPAKRTGQSSAAAAAPSQPGRWARARRLVCSSGAKRQGGGAGDGGGAPKMPASTTVVRAPLAWACAFRLRVQWSSPEPARTETWLRSRPVVRDLRARMRRAREAGPDAAHLWRLCAALRCYLPLCTAKHFCSAPQVHLCPLASTGCQDLSTTTAGQSEH